MDFKQLEAFVQVVELTSFSKAAEMLYVSQPSVSMYVTSLEKELNAVLINRSTKVISTTFAGELFYNKAKEIIELRHKTAEMLKNLTDDVSGDIRILASSVPSQYILPRMLSEFRKLYPKITFTVCQADTYEVVQGIVAHRADMGFAGSILGDKKCSFHEFVRESLVFIAPNDDSYPKHKKYTLEELLYSSSFISREFGSGTRMQYEKFFIENGIELDKIKTCACMDSTQSIVNAVINGLGISIVSELSVRSEVEQNMIQLINLEGALPVRKIYAVLSKTNSYSHLVKLFMEFIQSSSGLST